MSQEFSEENLNVKEKDPAVILRVVPAEEGFHFMTENGVYAGVTANSLEDFTAKLHAIDVESVVYHYYRGDFQRWIEGTLGDKDFADQLCFIPTNIAGETLRDELLRRLDKRLTDLKSLNWIETQGI
jgi:hypothetical protein